MHDRSPAPAAVSQRRAQALTWLVAASFFMEMLDGTVIATALPQMARSFGATPVDLNIGMTAYLLSVALFVPISGWAADRFGARRIFGGAIALFTFASLLCGLCNDLWSFTAARVLQGIGGAAMMPVGRLMVLRVTDKANLMRAIGTIVWPALVAPVLGPPLGGFLTDHASWRWIFFLNIPLGLAAFALALLLVPADRGVRDKPLDWRGFLLTGAALVATVYGTDRAGGGDMAALALVAVGLGLGTLAVRHMRRHPTPLFELGVMRLPTYAVGVWCGSAQRIAIGAVPFLLPLMFQLAFGLSAFEAGALTLFVFAGNLAMKAVTTPVLRRFGFRTVLLGNGVLAVLSLLACALLTPATPRPLVALLLFAGGLFRSMQFTALSTIQFADVPPDRMTPANTLASMLSQLTLGLGVVAGALALNLSAWLRGHAAGTPDLADFRNAFLLLALLAAAGLLDALRLDRGAGAAVSGRPA